MVNMHFCSLLEGHRLLCGLVLAATFAVKERTQTKCEVV